MSQAHKLPSCSYPQCHTIHFCSSNEILRDLRMCTLYQAHNQPPFLCHHASHHFRKSSLGRLSHGYHDSHRSRHPGSCIYSHPEEELGCRLSLLRHNSRFDTGFFWHTLRSSTRSSHCRCIWSTGQCCRTRHNFQVPIWCNNSHHLPDIGLRHSHCTIGMQTCRRHRRAVCLA